MRSAWLEDPGLGRHARLNPMESRSCRTKRSLVFRHLEMNGAREPPKRLWAEDRCLDHHTSNLALGGTSTVATLVCLFQHLDLIT